MRGGAEEYALCIGTAAVNRGWETHVAFPERDGTAQLRHDFTSNGTCYHSLEISQVAGHRSHFLVQVVRIIALLLKLKPDAVHLSLQFPDQCMAGIAACALLNFPAVIAFQLVTDELSVTDGQFRLMNWARKRNQQWIAISDNNRELLSKIFHVSKDDIVLVYNGPVFGKDDNLKNKKQDIIKEVRKELEFSDSDIIVLTVGRLHRQKGYSYLIPAIPHILKKHPNTRFVWVGEGEQRSELESLLKEYGVDHRVTLLGYRKDVPRLILAASIFLFPTLFEGGSSIALLEAMSYGLPIVASNASGIPEVVEDNVHGVLFRKADSCSLQAAIDWSLDHPEKMEEMAVSAGKRVKEFSNEIMSDKTLGLVEKMVGHR